jgi:alpha-D-ribose 1-methylphosphonate 5-triphosphate synthase subunit PhnH
MKPESIWYADVQQRLFRELVEAFSRPGSVRDLTPDLGGSSALHAALAALLDGETTLADPHGRIGAADWQLLQCRREAVETARYVAADGRRAPNFQPALGSLESPEFGATLLVEVDAVGSGDIALDLAGPGIRGAVRLSVAGLHLDWLTRRAEWNAGFPLGVDLLLADDKRVVALPRTTQILQLKEGH